MSECDTVVYHRSRRVSEVDMREGTSDVGVIVQTESSRYPLDLIGELTDTQLRRNLDTHRRYELDKLESSKPPRFQRVFDESQRFGSYDFLDVKKVLVGLDAFI